MRIIFENNHTPAIGKYRDAIVEDATNDLRYLYDACGTYVSISVNNAYRKFDFTSQTSIVIEHNLGRYPSVTVVNASGNQIFPGTVHYTDENNLTITLSAATTGFVVLN